MPPPSCWNFDLSWVLQTAVLTWFLQHIICCKILGVSSKRYLPKYIQIWWNQVLLIPCCYLLYILISLCSSDIFRLILPLKVTLLIMLEVFSSWCCILKYCTTRQWHSGQYSVYWRAKHCWWVQLRLHHLEWFKPKTCLHIFALYQLNSLNIQPVSFSLSQIIWFPAPAAAEPSVKIRTFPSSTIAMHSRPWAAGRCFSLGSGFSLGEIFQGIDFWGSLYLKVYFCLF